jgi:hypothetical protein
MVRLIEELGGMQMRRVLASGSLLCSLVAAIGSAACLAQPPLPEGAAAGDDILTPVTREWQERAIAHLSEFRPSAATPILEVEDGGEERLVVSYGPGGILWLGREDWVYLTSFWSHTADPQVILVIDRRGRIYRNFEHICPTLSLRVPEGAGVDSLGAFLKTETSEDDGPPRWVPIDDAMAAEDRETLPTAWEHQLEVATSQEASPRARGLAVCALIREGSDVSWNVVERVLRGTAGPAVLGEKRRLIVRTLAAEDGDRAWRLLEQVLAGSTDWPLLDEMRRLTADQDPARAAMMQRVLEDSLGATPLERGRHLGEAAVAAESRETLDYFLSLADAADRDAMCAVFEETARAQDTRLFYQLPGFGALRNSIAAFTMVDRERAAAFYRALLDSPDQHQREAAIYGVSELRLADTVGKLMALVDREAENSSYPSAVCVALGKIGTPEGHDALIELLLQEPIHAKQSFAVLCVMAEVCGGLRGRPQGSWSNGLWATVAEDRSATAERFASAMNELAERTTDERLAGEARVRASLIASQTP